MGDHRFDYPTAAASTSSLVWVRGAQLVADTPGLELNQKIRKSTGGTTRVKKYGDPNEVWPLTTIYAIGSGDEADWADVWTWIKTVCAGGVNTFEWTDSAGVVRTVRMVNDGKLSFPKFAYGTMSFTWMLEVV